MSRDALQPATRWIPNIKHPYMAQFTVGIERELFKDTSLGVTYINRKWNDIIGRYDTGPPTTPQRHAYSSALDEDFTVYERTAETVGKPITSSPT